jgi:ribosomal protein S18 acetylase RimI-like enzyme
VNPLLAAGFRIVERIEFMQLSRLQQRCLPVAPNVVGLSMADVEPDQLPTLAKLDACAFPSHWHFEEQALFSMLLGGRMKMAMVDGRPAGYWALGMNVDRDAHLSRLAVKPDWQGRGIGRFLLVDVLTYARRQAFHTVRLNTQSDNQAAQALYRSVGFRPTGQIIPLLVHSIA